MNGHIYFEIQADDLIRASGFYQKVFDWKIQENPHAPVDYMSIDTGGTRGGLLERSAETPPSEYGTNAYVCSIEVRTLMKPFIKSKKMAGKLPLISLLYPAFAGKAILSILKEIHLEFLKWTKKQSNQ